MIEHPELIRDVAKETHTKIELSKFEKNIESFIENNNINDLHENTSKKDIKTTELYDNNFRNKTIEQLIENTSFNDISNRAIINESKIPEKFDLSKQSVSNSLQGKLETDHEPKYDNFPCIREDLAGKNHPDTGVLYEKKIIEIDGIKKEGVFPKFESLFDVKLKKDLEIASDPIQNNYCNKELAKEVVNNKNLAGRFSERQLEQIKDNLKPEGYTWHHCPENGKMQLVNFEIHDKTRHTGGRNIWGGGTDHR